MFVAVEEGGGSVERVEGVVQSRALLGLLVGRAQEYPLLRGRHLDADLRVALHLESDGDAVELVAELAEVLVLPAGLIVLGGGRLQDGLNVSWVLADHLLDVLLNYTGGRGGGQKNTTESKHMVSVHG